MCTNIKEIKIKAGTKSEQVAEAGKHLEGPRMPRPRQQKHLGGGRT